MWAFIITGILGTVYLSLAIYTTYSSLSLTRKYYAEKGVDITTKQWQYIIKTHIPDIVGVGFALYFVYSEPLVLLFISPAVFFIAGDIYKLVSGHSTGIVKLD